MFSFEAPEDRPNASVVFADDGNRDSGSLMRTRRMFALLIVALAAVALLSYQCCAVNLAEQAIIAGDCAVNDVVFFAMTSRCGAFESHQGFKNLDTRSQRAYADLYKAAFLQRKTVTLNGFGGDELSEIMYIVWYDSPELFYVDPSILVHTVTTSTMAENEVSTATFVYLYDDVDIEEVRAAYDGGIREAARQFENCKSDADKVGAINRWIIGHVSYDEEAASAVENAFEVAQLSADERAVELDPTIPEAGTAYGALKNGKALCGGYAQLFCALCRECGVECQTILGSAGAYDDGHAWNAVRLEGVWRCVDVTWNDGLDNERAYYFASEDDFAVSGHRAYEGNVPPLV